MLKFSTRLALTVLTLTPLVWVTSFQSKREFTPYTQTIPNTTLSFDMVPIQGGTFKMGSAAGSPSAQPDEIPQHEVTIDPFWMGSHEVTWDLFEVFLDKNFESSISEAPLTPEVDGLSRPSIPYLDMTFGMGKESKPAIGMTQYGAIQYCRWLYLKTGIFYRLPTEAEWEYASRAGSTSEYFFGDSPAALGDYAWYAANSQGSTQEVGKKKPNPWGLYDILGNVQEWTVDHYNPDAYKQRESKGTKNPKLIDEELYPKVIRGGSYASPEADLRSAKRIASTATWKRIDPQIPKSQWWFPEAPFLGLRVVRPVTPPSPEEIATYFGTPPQEDY
jgi:formylglycine-generating enzyme required for sulfatase activity